MNNVWKTLSRIDVSEGVEKKGGLDYLSWAYAWAKLMEHYPDSTYEFHDPAFLPDGSVMVRASVTVLGTTHTMQLPVLDHRNKPIQNPNSFDFNSAQMRCLVKAIAMHGLGVGLYLGDLKETIKPSYYNEAVELITDGYPIPFHQFVKGLSEQDQIDTFNEAPKGEKTAFKNKWNELFKEAEQYFEDVVCALREGIDSNSHHGIIEIVEEMSDYEKKVIWGRLTDIEKQQIKNMMAEAA